MSNCMGKSLFRYMVVCVRDRISISKEELNCCITTDITETEGEFPVTNRVNANNYGLRYTP